MSCILYYSNYCDNCKNIIRIITKNNKTSDMHFISIDKREKHKDTGKPTTNRGQLSRKSCK